MGSGEARAQGGDKYKKARPRSDGNELFLTDRTIYQITKIDPRGVKELL